MIVCDKCKQEIRANIEPYWEIIKHNGITEPDYNRTMVQHIHDKCMHDKEVKQ